ncbi:ADAMTS-like protein 5 [Trichonephila inaurata madagascariensis]|uniref:ADAMTS-like protein 5 n=1 Tax=Trichonephila inaurata madagascariensis TaxID=2747483 RepID=A0A8X6WWR9_9ARAC|nr:ADAMTS-like protein 5 [Trichonephila inaurata madagascariensis]
MKYLIILRLSFYLLYSSFTCEGLNYYSHQRDSKHNSGVSVKSSPILRNNTDQLYSQWSEWTPCSVTCGRGIISRTRTCLKSMYNSRGVLVPLCHGEFSEHKICNLQPCPASSLGIRESQCSQYNNQVIAGKFIKKWIPANGGPNPCEMRCEAVPEKLVYGFGKATDGTPCTLGVCLDGRCLRVGCDDRLGSGVTLDMCGVCGGRNSNCVHYKDVYQGQASSGSAGKSSYHEVVVIPVTARNLIIRQPLVKNILALQDRSKGIIFNREQNAIKYGGHFEIAGSQVEFLKLDDVAEELIVKGPLNQELYVLVLLRAHNPGIYYEYWLPKQAYTPGRGHYSINPPNNVIPSTLPTPSSSQSYTVPIFESVTKPTYSPPHRHPSKPPFAYGYGEKPYKGHEYPIFRHIPSTSSPSIEKKGYLKASDTESFSSIANDAKQHFTPFKRGAVPIYRPKPKPSLDFYQTFRNASRIKHTDLPKAEEVPDYVEELPVLTQGDSSSSNGDGGRHLNVIPQATAKEKKHELSISKYPKPFDVGIPVNKRVEDPYKNYVPNGRLKYSFDSKNTDGVYANTSGGFKTPAPLTINVLPGPSSGKSKPFKDKTKDDRAQKARSTRGGNCEPCQRNRDQTKHFCLSDFVIRASVIGYEFLQGETRYELDVRQSFKNTFSLLPREYVWSPDTCRCPKLRPGKEYIIMGKSDHTYKKRESRLLVDKTCFVRTFNLKYARRLQKLRKDQDKKCKKTS